MVTKTQITKFGLNSLKDKLGLDEQSSVEHIKKVIVAGYRPSEVSSSIQSWVNRHHKSLEDKQKASGNTSKVKREYYLTDDYLYIFGEDIRTFITIFPIPNNLKGNKLVYSTESYGIESNKLLEKIKEEDLEGVIVYTYNQCITELDEGIKTLNIETEPLSKLAEDYKKEREYVKSLEDDLNYYQLKGKWEFSNLSRVDTLDGYTIKTMYNGFKISDTNINKGIRKLVTNKIPFCIYYSKTNGEYKLLVGYWKQLALNGYELISYDKYLKRYLMEVENVTETKIDETKYYNRLQNNKNQKIKLLKIWSNDWVGI